MTDDTIGDKSTDKTVENAEEMGGGYGGPFPAEPEMESVGDETRADGEPLDDEK